MYTWVYLRVCREWCIPGYTSGVYNSSVYPGIPQGVYNGGKRASQSPWVLFPVSLLVDSSSSILSRFTVGQFLILCAEVLSVPGF